MARYKRDFTGERRTAGLTVQFTPSEREALEQRAKEAGAGLGEYIREQCIDRAPTVVNTKHRNPEAKRLMDELRAIGINLNQIARRANITGEIRGHEDGIRDALEFLKRTMTHVLTL
jgi:hypothetical protein